MDLNDIPEKLGPALIFMLAVWFLTLAVRRIIEHLWPKLVHRGTWWEDIALPTLPYALGASFAIVMHKFPGLEALPSWGTRALYGLVGGALSGLTYRIVKTIAKKKYGVELSMPPGAIAGASVVVDVPASQLPKIDVHYPGKTENENLPDSQKPTDPGSEPPKGDST